MGRKSALGEGQWNPGAQHKDTAPLGDKGQMMRDDSCTGGKCYVLTSQQLSRCPLEPRMQSEVERLV